MTLEALTKRQADVLDFIRQNIEKRGFGPTVREIAEQFNISSPNGVTCHLAALAEKGFIVRQKGLSRSIQLTEMAAGPSGLPLIAVEDIEVYDAPDYGYEIQYIETTGLIDNAKRDHFIVQLETDAPGVCCVKGDFLIMKKKRTAKKGQFVIVRDDAGEPVLAVWTGESNTRGTKLLLPGAKMKTAVMKSPKILAGAVGMFRLL